MGCNCGKNKAATTVKKPTTAQPTAQPVVKQTVTRSLPQRPVRAYGQVQTFSLTDSAGRVQTFGSALEANAARVRRGGVVTAL